MDETQDKLILMVEDSSDVHLLLSDYLGMRNHRAKLLSAYTLEEGVTLFRTHQGQLSIIILDGCLEPRGNEIHTLPLLAEIKTSGFGGRVIASSSNRKMREEMRALGCTLSIEKGNLVKYLHDHL